MRDRNRDPDGDAAETACAALVRRCAAFWHFQVVDHAALRLFWTNLHPVADGVWRANQPAPGRIRRYARMGIRTIVSLRGTTRGSHHGFEAEACRHHRIALRAVRLRAHRLVARDKLLALLDLFEEAERPLLLHCKSGSDRTGFAAALYLLHMEGAAAHVARRQLGWRYLHRRGAAAGILDHVLAAYAADCRAAPIPIRRWIETRYDPDALAAGFRASRSPPR